MPSVKIVLCLQRVKSVLCVIDQRPLSVTLLSFSQYVQYLQVSGFHSFAVINKAF